MTETITTRNERAARYSRHAERCRYRRRVLVIQWASVAAVLFLGATIVYLLSLTEVI